MVPEISNVTPDQDIPSRTGVVVIGGGIIGVSAALFLARAKVPVVIFEKGEIGAEQSGRNQGWVRNTNRDPREIPLAMEALRLWGSLNEMVGEETGFRKCGIVFAAQSDSELAGREAWMAASRDYQTDSRIITAERAKEMMPGLAMPLKGALWSPSDGRAEPQLAAPAIARGAQRHGAKIFTNCAVIDVERKGGRVSAVLTERGRVECDAVILAGGAWSNFFASGLGVRFPQLKIRSSVMQISEVEGGPEASFGSSSFGFRKRLDGGYTVANFENHVADIVPDSFRFLPEFLPILRRRWRDLPLRIGSPFFQELGYARNRGRAGSSPYQTVRVLNPAPRVAQSLAAKAKLDKAFPAFKEASVVQHWAGYIDVTPDEIPVISQVDQIPGLIVATGFSGHGFGIGPAAGRLAAELASGVNPSTDPSAFRISRFSDKSWETMPNYR